ncbi:uncharacterized protein RCO7_14972 [Rhynchosporium graminicola]|uniref:Uncharacterized protein n=1 Tax=Rhynchosporium graminicola TaxID=2792576 RepID=A0A1E1LCR1_9HELO|nr:uncharacterized protein RCO7_14972 [Rhynchosporium commune]
MTRIFLRTLLDEQKARMETDYIADPLTDKMILNPVNDSPLNKR